MLQVKYALQAARDLRGTLCHAGMGPRNAPAPGAGQTRDVERKLNRPLRREPLCDSRRRAR